MARDVTIAGRSLALAAGDSAERMERVAEYARRTLAELDALNESRGNQLDEQGRALELALRLADELFMAQDENARLRRELMPLRKRCFEAESERDRLARELAALRAELDAAQQCEPESQGGNSP